MKHSLVRPAFLSLALLGTVALVSRAQEEPTKEKPVERKTPNEAAEAGDVRDFSGKYLADGVSNTGKPYKAMVEIIRDKDVYQVVWVLGPREGYSGVGIVEGNALCVGWAVGQVPGVVIYKPDTAEPNAKLLGRWTAPGSKGRTFRETLTPIP